MSAMNDEDHEEIARSIFNDMLNNDWDAADQKIIQNRCNICHHNYKLIFSL